MKRVLRPMWWMMVVVSAALAGTGCPEAAPAVEVEPPRVPAPEPGTLERLRTAPESLAVAGTTLTVSSYAWRDFMPISPPGGKPLIAAVTITATDAAFPQGLDATRLWLIRGDEVWDAPLSEAERLSSPGRLKKRARNGPKWPPGEKIDVVVEIVGDGATKHLLRRAGETIQATH